MFLAALTGAITAKMWAAAFNESETISGFTGFNGVTCLIWSGLLLSPFIWRGPLHLWRAFSLCLPVVAMLAIFDVSPSDSSGIVWTAIAVALVRGSLQSERSVLPLTTALLLAVMVSTLALKRLPIGTAVAIIAGFTWLGLELGDGLAQIARWRGNPSWPKRSTPEAPTWVKRVAGMGRDLRRKSILVISGLAVIGAIGLDSFETLWGVPRTWGYVVVEPMVLAFLLLFLRGASSFGIGLLTVIPLAPAVASVADRQGGGGGALVLAFASSWLWGAVQGRPWRKAMGTLAGLALAAAAISLAVFLWPLLPFDRVVGELNGFLAFPVMRVLMVTGVTIIFQSYTLAVDALVDWLAQDEAVPAGAPKVDGDGLTTGDVGLLRARILVSGSVMRALSVGMLVLGVALPWAVMKLRSMHRLRGPPAGTVRPELVAVDVNSMGGSPAEADLHVAVSMSRVTWGDVYRLTGQRPLFVLGDERSPALLESGWWGISLTSALEYCNELSRLEGLLPCYAALPGVTAYESCNGYQLLTHRQWVSLVEVYAKKPGFVDLDGHLAEVALTRREGFGSCRIAPSGGPSCDQVMNGAGFRVMRILSKIAPSHAQE